jgi:hypothetical protein
MARPGPPQPLNPGWCEQLEDALVTKKTVALRGRRRERTEAAAALTRWMMASFSAAMLACPPALRGRVGPRIPACRTAGRSSFR